MKIRLDFVTNSSSSSFVAVKINSKKLKNLLERYDVHQWEEDEDGWVIYEDEDVTGESCSYDSVETVMDWFVELLELFNRGNRFVEEYKGNRSQYIDDVEGLVYIIDESNWGEWEDSPELHDSFEYVKKKAAKKKKAKKTPVPESLREGIIDELNQYSPKDNIEEIMRKYEGYYIKGYSEDNKSDTSESGRGWIFYDGVVELSEKGFLYFAIEENRKYNSYKEEIEARINMPLEDHDLKEIPLTMLNKYSAKANLSKVEKGDTLKLYREPDNEKDTNAIFATSLNDEYLGYIDGVKAEYLAPIVDNKKLCWKGIFVGNVQDRRFNIRPGITIELFTDDKNDPKKGILPVEVSKPKTKKHK